MSEKLKPYKNISKVYEKFYKDIDWTWTNETPMDKLFAPRDIQNKYRDASNRSDIEELEKQVKNLKDKSLEAVLKILEQ